MASTDGLGAAPEGLGAAPGLASTDALGAAPEGLASTDGLGAAPEGLGACHQNVQFGDTTAVLLSTECAFKDQAGTTQICGTGDYLYKADDKDVGWNTDYDCLPGTLHATRGGGIAREKGSLYSRREKENELEPSPHDHVCTHAYVT